MLKHRRAETHDLQSVYDLYMDKSANPFLTFDPMSIETFAPIFHSMVGDNTLFVCESGDDVVATYRLVRKTHRQTHIWYLGGFTVSNHFTGKGIGYQILEELKNAAKQAMIARIELTVDTENTKAINLYRKIGFEIEGKLRNNYRLASTGLYYDEFLMALLLH